MKGETWNRLFSPLVAEIFEEYIKHGGVLFGATGDLDNLGVYVARNGRPTAENLVDLYNQTIRNYLDNWTSKNEQNLLSVAFIPSGEEVLILGISKNAETPQRLFKEIREGIGQLMENQKFIDTGDTASSFGGIIFGNKYDQQIRSFVEGYNTKHPDGFLYPIYLSILTGMRTEMAIQLDRNKFQDILDGQHPIELRQLVLTRMLLYKTTTKNILKSLNSLDRDEINILLNMLGNIYGINPGTETAVDNLYNDIISRNTGPEKS